MDPAGRLFLPLLAANVFAVLAISHLLLGRALRYATIAVAPGAERLLWLLPPVFGACFGYERLVRGTLYGRLRGRLPAGLAAPTVAALGAIAPAAVRLTVLPRPRAPFTVLLGQAGIVELLLGLGLAWLALGSSSTVPGGLALALVWAVRLTFVATFRGGAVPLLEVVAAGAAALSVALVLKDPLAPHRNALMGAG